MFKTKQEAAVWAWMCDTARFKAHAFQTRFGLVQLERGQLLISQRLIAEEFGLGRQQVRRLIDNMTITRMITENSTHSASRAGTIITIVNYEEYQSDTLAGHGSPTQEKIAEQPIINPRPTHNQPTREEREIKKERKEEEEEERPSVSSIGEPIVAPCAADQPPRELSLPAIDTVGPALAAYEHLRAEFVPNCRAIQLTPERRKKLALRIAEIGGNSEWAVVLSKIRGSRFLRGETSRTGFVPQIDWILKPENLRKVREGNYDDPPRRGKSGIADSQPPIDAMRAARSANGLGGS